MILHTPHSSFVISPEVRASINLGEEDLKQELIRMTDAFKDELFDLDGRHRKVVYPVSRIVCDPERFLDDDAESMSKIGIKAGKDQVVMRIKFTKFRLCSVYLCKNKKT